MNRKWIESKRVAIDREIVRRFGFVEFVHRAWPIVDNAQFVNNWHITEIANFLNDVAIDRFNGIKREFCICIPPASTKSRIASVLWQPWIWTWWKEATFISCTYEGGPGSLALKLSRLSRQLVQSSWYQKRWPLTLDKAGESLWSNVSGGVREAVGTGMAITGDHYHFHLGDDLIPEQMSRVGTPAAIAKALEKARGFWWSTLATREKELGKTARGIIGQRLHRDDPPGEGERRGYEMMVFPAHFDPQRADPRDHRKIEGELLCPERANEKYYQNMALSLAPAGAAAQLEQNPVPPGGSLIEEKYLENRYSILPSRVQRAIESGIPGFDMRFITAWDLTFKGKETSNWVVGQFWCAHNGEYFLIDQVRGRLGFRASKMLFIDFINKYNICKKHIIEDAANAAALEDDLKSSIPGIVLEPHGGGCLARTQHIEGVWASGAVRLPMSAPWLGGGDGFIAEHLAFDGLGTRHDDQVAASSLALVHLAKGKSAKWAQWGKIKP